MTAPRRPPPRATLSPLAHRVFRATVVLTLVLMGALLADILFGWRLPQVIRPSLPIALAVALTVALAIGVAAFGAPRRPGDGQEPE